MIWYPVLLLLLGAALAVEIPPPVRAAVRAGAVAVAVVCATVLYLGYHWLTDVVGALLVGAVLDRALRRVAWLPSVPAEAAVGRQHDAR